MPFDVNARQATTRPFVVHTERQADTETPNSVALGLETLSLAVLEFIAQGGNETLPLFYRGAMPVLDYCGDARQVCCEPAAVGYGEEPGHTQRGSPLGSGVLVHVKTGHYLSGAISLLVAPDTDDIPPQDKQVLPKARRGASSKRHQLVHEERWKHGEA